jgi:hypothetical protein
MPSHVSASWYRKPTRNGLRHATAPAALVEAAAVAALPAAAQKQE